MRFIKRLTDFRPKVQTQRSRTISVLVLVGLIFSYTPMSWVNAAGSSTVANQPMGISRFGQPNKSDRALLNSAIGQMALSFEANQGQVDPSVKFFSHGGGYNLFLTATEAVLSLHKSAGGTFDHRTVEKRTPVLSDDKHKNEMAVLRMKLIGANSNPRVTGLDELPGKSNYFSGRDAKRWRTNVPNYARVKYSGVYPGVDLVYYSNQQQIEYDFVVSPRANPHSIRLEIKGADRIEIDARGDLVLHTPLGEIRQRKPVIYQDVNNSRREISGGYVIKGRQQVCFQVGDYDITRPLVIDPAVVYSTYLGGSGGGDYANGIAVYTDPATGVVYTYVVGRSDCNDFPIKNGLQPSQVGSVFVAKFNTAASGDASLVYSTFIQGTIASSLDGDYPSTWTRQAGIAVDSAGNAYVTGKAASNFPTVNAFQSTSNSEDAFIAKLSPDGSALIYSSFLGGSGIERGKGIAVDSAGNAYVVGDTSSADFPTVNAFQSTRSGVFVAKIVPPSGSNPASLVYSTYLGGSVTESGVRVAVDQAGNIHVTGTTASPDFPTRNALQSTFSFASWPPLYSHTAFYSKLDPSVSGPASLVYSTYLGSGTAGPFIQTNAYGIAVDAAGNAYICGNTGNFLGGTATNDSNFPSTSAIGPPLFSVVGYVIKIDSSRSGAASLVYSTIINPADALGIAVDPAGNAYVTGDVSIGLPLVGATQQYNDGVLVSVDGGDNWTGFCKGINSFGVSCVAVDTSTTPRTLYAGTGVVYGNPASGVYKSTDGGANWSAINTGLTNLDIRHLAVSPVNPSTVYAATNGGIFRSLNGGSSWTALNNGLSETAQSYVGIFAFDQRTTPATLYAATGDGLYKISEGGNTWNLILAGVTGGFAIDSKTTPSTLYVGCGQGVRKSMDGGNTWTNTAPIYPYNNVAKTIAVDTSTTPSTLYAAQSECIYSSCSALNKSTDSGQSWQGLNTADGRSGFPYNFFPVNMVVDPTTVPSTIYVIDGFDSSDGMIRSTDGGNSWTFIISRPIPDLVIDTTSATSNTRPTLYAAGSIEQADACVMVIDPTGSNLLFSTYLGGIGWDYGSDIAFDSAGNIYVTGSITSFSFPVVNAYQATHGARFSNPFSPWTTFTVKLGRAALPANSAGSVTTEMSVETGTLELSFPNITGSITGTAPTVTVDPIDSATTANLTLSNNLGAYDIKTTATYNTSGYSTDPTQGIKIAFNVLTINDPTVFNGLVITHGEDSNNDGIIQPSEMIPYNGTVDPNKTTYHDFATRTIWVYVPSLSPFVITKGATDQLGDLIRLVKSFNLQRGIENSLDAKLQNAQDALAAARSGNRLSACNSMASFINEAQAQSGMALTVAQANQLIASSKQIRTTLGCR